MAHDPTQIERLARTYTEAWCSRDPARVAGHYHPGAMITINGGDAAPIAEAAEAFIAAFPDIEVFMDDLVLREDGTVEYRWTFTGTNAETGKSVRVPGLRGVDDRSRWPDRRVTRPLRPSRVRPPGPARHRLGPLADLRRHSGTLGQPIL